MNLQDQLLSNILIEEDEEKFMKKEEFGLFRSGSAPPDIVQPTMNSFSSSDEMKSDYRYDPAYYNYYYSQRLVNPRLPPPIVNWRTSGGSSTSTSIFQKVKLFSLLKK
jgi:hypothetical protein